MTTASRTAWRGRSSTVTAGTAARPAAMTRLPATDTPMPNRAASLRQAAEAAMNPRPSGTKTRLAAIGVSPRPDCRW
ncbi:hypothetical protein [Streptomyces sp. TRM68367]|uniref:hypothetical protein n=1 Tax=Streptomyces sp. TRM68367 TaxID=2758415 RepID=UPI00165AA71B|nr:hypothetical protein [Streptomyces sp. TRM68367]MBC9728170.1 hypothetical protein [Streptomyces sp. TRM68367]